MLTIVRPTNWIADYCECVSSVCLFVVAFSYEFRHSWEIYLQFHWNMRDFYGIVICIRCVTITLQQQRWLNAYIVHLCKGLAKLSVEIEPTIELHICEYVHWLWLLACGHWKLFVKHLQMIDLSETTYFTISHNMTTKHFTHKCCLYDNNWYYILYAIDVCSSFSSFDIAYLFFTWQFP